MMPYLGVFPLVLRALCTKQTRLATYMMWRRVKHYSKAEYTHVVGNIYLKRAFSAPRICTVEAGHLAREVREPAFWMRRAATVSPMRVDKLGATVAIFSSR
jgi:hypothetical protein